MKSTICYTIPSPLFFQFKLANFVHLSRNYIISTSPAPIFAMFPEIIAFYCPFVELLVWFTVEGCAETKF